MKNLTFSVHLTFDDLINPQDIEEVGRKVFYALRNEVERGEGIAPDYTFTESIGVSFEGVFIMEGKMI